MKSNFDEVLIGLEVSEIKIKTPMEKAFLTRSEIIYVGEILLKYGGDNGLKHFTMWMLGAFAGVRPHEMIRLQFEHFDLKESGELEVDEAGYSRLHIPAGISKMENSPSHPLYGTLLVPQLVTLLNKYFKTIYDRTGKIGTGHIFLKNDTVNSAMTDLPHKSYTPWLKKYKKILIELPPKKRLNINLKTGRRSMNELIRNNTVLKNQMLSENDRFSAALIHMRHSKSKDINTNHYTQEISFSKYRQIIDSSLNFPWNQDELQIWEKEMYRTHQVSENLLIERTILTESNDAYVISQKHHSDLKEKFRKLQLCKPAGMGIRELSNLTPMILQQHYNYLTRNKVISDENIRKVHILVKNALKKAERWGLVAKNVATLVDTPKVVMKEMKVWDVEQVRTFLEVAKKSPYYIIFLLALSTGMRKGEVLGLSWRHVNIDEGYLSIVQVLNHSGELEPGAKTAAGIRSIDLDDTTIDGLKKHKEKILEQKRNAGHMYQDFDLVNCTTVGNRIDRSNVTRTFKELTKKAGLPRIRFHDLRHTHANLRHTHATLLLKQGVHPKIVAERLGHADIRMTIEKYSHILPRMQKDTAKAFGNMVFGT